jgi:xanthosine utilization system XapX-like protein
MALVFQLGAVLMAGFVVAVAWTAKPAPAAIARSIGVLAMALGYIAFWGHVWQTGSSFWSQHAKWKSMPRVQAEVAGGRLVLPRVSTEFAEWIRERLKPGDRFYIDPSSAPRNEAVYQWYTFRLLPNLASEKPEQADWLIFYGMSPEESKVSDSIPGIAQHYRPGYSISRVRHAR